jgi:transposase
MVAAKIANLERGDNQHTPIGGTSQEDAARLLNVGERSVQRAKKVLDEGSLILVSKVESGEVAVSTAADIEKKIAQKTIGK